MCKAWKTQAPSRPRCNRDHAPRARPALAEAHADLYIPAVLEGILARAEHRPRGSAPRADDCAAKPRRRRAGRTVSSAAGPPRNRGGLIRRPLTSGAGKTKGRGPFPQAGVEGEGPQMRPIALLRPSKQAPMARRFRSVALRAGRTRATEARLRSGAIKRLVGDDPGPTAHSRIRRGFSAVSMQFTSKIGRQLPQRSASGW